MPREPQSLVFVGIKKNVLALDPKTGEAVWRAELKRADFVSVLWDGESLFAANGGEVFRLDPRDGRILWNNPLKGLGFGMATLASMRSPQFSSGGDLLAAAKTRRDQAAAAE